jgi:hypothetical protein
MVEYETCEAHKGIGPDLGTLSVAKLSTEWWRVADHPSEYRDITGDDHDHGECRFLRLEEIQDVLNSRRATTLEQALQKYRIFELNDGSGLLAPKDFSEAIGDCNLNRSATLRSLLEDLHHLSKAA